MGQRGSRQCVGRNLGAGRVSPRLLSLSCIRDLLLGLAFDLNCMGSHIATKERKIVSRVSTHLIPHRTAWPPFPGVLGLAGVVAEPLCSGAGRGRAFFYLPLFLALCQHTPGPGQQTQSQLVESCCHLLGSLSPPCILSPSAAFPKGCCSLLSQIPTPGATCLPLQRTHSAGASDSCLCLWHRGRSHHPCKQGCTLCLAR